MALSRAQTCPDVKGELDLDLSEGAGYPWEGHGRCHKTKTGDDLLVLRTHVPEFGMEES